MTGRDITKSLEAYDHLDRKLLLIFKLKINIKTTVQNFIWRFYYKEKAEKQQMKLLF